MPNVRVIFPQLDLFVGPAATSGTTATGALYSSGNSGQNLIAQLSRVQGATLNIGINRQDIFQYGQTARIDSVIVSPPTVSLDFSYYPTNGYNEYLLGFAAQGGSFISGFLTKASDSKNYFLAISPNGTDDAFNTNQFTRDTYAVGNGYVSNYSLNASVGQIPTVSVTVDAFTAMAFTGSSGSASPAINLDTQTRVTPWTFQLPVGDPVTGGNNISALRPTDITLSFPTAAGFLSPLSGSNTVNVQSFSMSVPIGREVLNRLGAPYGFSREIQLPVTCTMNIRALATNVVQNSIDTLLCNDGFTNLAVTMRQPSCAGTGLAGIVLGFNNAKMTSYSFGSTLGSDSTVDLNFATTIAGPTSLDGITLSGFGVR